MRTSLLHLDGISKSFGRVTVAKDLTLRVEPGEALGIVGPNGAGKSSLFAMISGDLRPDAGAVRFDGRDVTGVPPHARTRAGVGRTYQVPRPFEHLTAFENVLVCAHQGAALKGGAQAHAMEVLERTGLAALANTPGGRLTLLQRKRLEVARGLATSPKLLLLDEVAYGLTEPEVLELVEIIKDLHAAVSASSGSSTSSTPWSRPWAGWCAWPAATSSPTASRWTCWPTRRCASCTWAAARDRPAGGRRRVRGRRRGS